MKKYLGLALVLMASTSVFAADGKITGTKFKQQCLICHVANNPLVEGVPFPVSPDASTAMTNLEFHNMFMFLRTVKQHPLTANVPSTFNALADALMDQGHFTGDGPELKDFFDGIAAGDITTAQ